MSTGRAIGSAPPAHRTPSAARRADHGEGSDAIRSRPRSITSYSRGPAGLAVHRRAPWRRRFHRPRRRNRTRNRRRKTPKAACVSNVATTGLGGFSRFRSMGDQTVYAVDPRFPRRRQGAMICRSRSEPRTRWRREATPQRKVSPSTPLASSAVRPGPSGKNFHRHFHRGIRTSGRADKYSKPAGCACDSLRLRDTEREIKLKGRPSIWVTNRSGA